MTYLLGLAVVIAALLVPAIQIRGINGPSSAVFSQYLGIAALITMSLSQVIATRARFVEPIFGPLDRAYVLHKWLGITALVAILLHDTIGAEIKELGPKTALSNFAEGLGEQSLNGLLILIAITLITIIPYRIWYWTHRAIGLCFVLASLHFALILKPFSDFDPLGLYVLGFCTVGVVSYIYTLLPRDWRRGHLYWISEVRQSGNASVISLSPEGAPLRHVAGQFAFFTIEEKGLSETHPFTISSAARDDGVLRVSVGALGDGTNKIAREIREGMTVKVHGPYGRFAPQRGRGNKVWIAGGIGITPFLAALESLKEDGPSVDLFYSYRGASNAPHLAEVQALAAGLDRVTLRLFDTATGARLTAQDVANVSDGKRPNYYFCGPTPLREALQQELGSRGFHFEAFEIRTGLPFPRNTGQILADEFGRFRRKTGLT